MQLLVIVVNQEEDFNKIIPLLIEAGVSGGTLFETEGIGQFLSYDVPIFAGLRGLTGDKQHKGNKTILSVIENQQILENLKKLLLEEGINFSEPGRGLFFTLPIEEVFKPTY